MNYERGPLQGLTQELLSRTPVQVPGEHLWIVAGAWKVNPENWHSAGRVDLDVENMVSLSGLGCYWCEREYEKRLTYRRCPGEPRG